MNNKKQGGFSAITVVDHSNENLFRKKFNDLALWWRGVSNILKLSLRRNKEGAIHTSHDLRGGIR